MINVEVYCDVCSKTYDGKMARTIADAVTCIRTLRLRALAAGWKLTANHLVRCPDCDLETSVG